MTPEQRILVLGSRLREARELMGWSQQEAADKLDMSRPSLTMLENGKRQVKALELLDMVTLYETSIPKILEDL